VSRYTITITNPVPDMIGGSINPLLKATAIGGNVSQTANATYDGAACDRLAVEITRSRNSVFAGVAGSNNQSTTVHSVARYNPASGGPKIPALVALNKTACPSIDASSGTIHVYNNGTYPGIIDADSKATAASCSSATTFNAGSNGSIIADSNTDTPPMAGILGYSAPALSSAFPSVGTYTGTPTYEVPRTRSYPDSTYHCGNVSPLPTGCTTGAGGTDAISSIQSNYGVLGNPGFAADHVLSGASCNPSSAVSYLAGNWYVDCPTFTVGTTVTFGAGTIVINGNLSLVAHGNLTIGTASADSTLVVRGTTGITTASNGWAINWYRTTVVMTNNACQTTGIASCGTLSMNNGNGTWTAPAAGPTKGLIYWTETSQTTAFQGNPTLTWNGVFFAGSSLFDLQGNAGVNATDVQLWVDSVTLNNNGAWLTLRPDPNTAIHDIRPGSALIR